MWIITKAFYLFIWISVTQVYAQYFITEKNTTWREALEVCDMVINLNLNVSLKDFVVDADHGIALEDDVWVGLFMKKTGFEYIGCASKPDRKADVISMQNTPGLCYSECSDTDFVGLRENECYCLSGEPDKFNDTCTWLCPHTDWIFCGGTNELSVYRANDAVPVDDSESNGNCLSYQYYSSNNRPKTWDSCSKPYLLLCMEGNTYKPVGVKQHEQWKISIQHCNKLSLRPLNYEGLGGINETVYPSWTGIIQSDVLYTIKDFEQSYSNILYGFLKNDSNTSQIILAFTASNYEKKYTLCHNSVSTAQPPSTISASLTVNVTDVVSSTVLSKSQTSTSSISVSQTTMTTSHTASNITEENPIEHIQSMNQNMKDSSVTVPVVVSVCAVFIIAISIAVIILKRRGKIPDICRTKSTTHKNKYESSVKKPTESNQYEHVDDMISNSKIDRNTDVETDNTNYAHTYFVLENVEKQPEYEDALGKHAKEMEDSNVYNTLEQELDKKRKQSKTTDNTYDTTKTVAEKLKSKFGEDSDAFGDTDENLYNHTNSVNMKNNNTENVYNVTEDNENAYGDTDTNHENKAHGDDDTYNHI